MPSNLSAGSTIGGKKLAYVDGTATPRVLSEADYVRQPGYGVTAGSVNAYTLTLSPAPTAYVEGMCISVKFHITNTNSSTINVNGLGAKPIYDSKGLFVSNNRLVASAICTLRYNGSAFILQGEGGDDGGLHPGKIWSLETAIAGAWAGIAFGANTFVAIRSTTTSGVMTSSTGKSWTARTTPQIYQNATTTGYWKAICFGDGKFVALATESNPTNVVANVMTSTSGFTWTGALTHVKQWTSVVYGNGMYVAVGYSSNIQSVMTSYDGINWTLRDAFIGQWESVAYGNGRFVAVASGTYTEATGKRLMSSTDGINWEITTLTGTNIVAWSSISFGNGSFVAVETSTGGLGSQVLILSEPSYMPSNGMVASSENVRWHMVAFGGDSWVALSSDDTANQVMYSTTLMVAGEWYLFPAPRDGTTALNWKGIVYGNGRFVAVANSPSSANSVMTSIPSTDFGSFLTRDNAGKTSIGDALTSKGANASPTDGLALNAKDILKLGSVPGLRWDRRATAANHSWKSITYGENRFVAIQSGSNNVVMVSVTGDSWSTTPTPSSSGWQSICYAKGKFVVVGQAGSSRAMWSNTGTGWFLSSSIDSSTNWQSVTYGNGRFVAVGTRDGSSPDVSISTDGMNWTNTTSGSLYGWNSICFGDGIFVAVHNSGTTQRIGTSTDGTTWTLQTAPDTLDLRAVCYGNGMFVALIGTGTGNHIITSSDGVSWTYRSSANSYTWLNIAYGDGMFVAIGNENKLLVSPDGINWSVRPGPVEYTFNPGWTGICYAIGRFVVVGVPGNGYCAMVSDAGANLSYYFSSVDGARKMIVDTLAERGTTKASEKDSILKIAEYVRAMPMVQAGAVWLSKTGSANNSWAAICYGLGLFVAISPDGGTTHIMTSTDGSAWTSRATPNSYWTSVCFGNGLFVAVGQTSGANVLTSTDGKTWIPRSTPSSSWNSVTYGEGLFVAVSVSTTGNMVMTSSDGIDWTVRTPASSNAWSYVTHAAGKFVAVSTTGSGNRVMVSADGITWMSGTTPADNYWSSIAYGNGIFVSVAWNGTGNRVMASYDGITWFSVSYPVDNGWTSVAFGNGIFVAVSDTGTGNRAMTSPDGLNWTLRTTPVDTKWRSVCYGGNKFVAVGIDAPTGNVMISERVI